MRLPVDVPDVVDVVAELFPSSVSLTHSVGAPRSFVRSLPPNTQSATHVLLGRASVAIATVARPRVNLSSHDPRGGTGAGRLGHVTQAG